MKKSLILSTFLASMLSFTSAFAGDMININKADVATLDTLDGIGAKKAEAIVAYRTEHGDFKTLEDIKEVSGIGDKLFDKIKGSISLTEGSSTADKSEKTDSAKAKTEDKAAKGDKTTSDKSAAVEKSANKADKS